MRVRFAIARKLEDGKRKFPWFLTMDKDRHWSGFPRVVGRREVSIEGELEHLARRNVER